MTAEIKHKIHELAVKQITADFELIKQKSAGETLYGFGIGIVEDITGFFSAGNSIASLKRILSENGEEEIDPCYFWCISEWVYEGTNDNSLYEFLATFIYDIEEGKHESVMKDYETVLIKALKTCHDKGVFGTGKEREDLMVYLHYADATDEDIDDLSSQQINSKHSHVLFKERWNDEVDNLTKHIIKKMNRLPNGS